MRKAAILPLLAGFFVMGFGDIIGTVMNQVKAECAAHANAISWLMPIFAYVWFFAIMQMGVLSGEAVNLSFVDGCRYFAACMPMAIGGLVSAAAQGKVAAASVNLLAKNEEHWSKGMILCITVEFYAILSLLASFMMLVNI